MSRLTENHATKLGLGELRSHADLAKRGKEVPRTSYSSPCRATTTQKAYRRCTWCLVEAGTEYQKLVPSKLQAESCDK